MSLYSQGEPVDPVTVAEELRRAGHARRDRRQGRAAAHPGRRHRRRRTRRTTRRSSASSRCCAGSSVRRRHRGDGLRPVRRRHETLDRAESLVFEVAERRVADSMVAGSRRSRRRSTSSSSSTGQRRVTGVPDRLPRPRRSAARPAAVDARRRRGPPRRGQDRRSRSAPRRNVRDRRRARPVLFFSMEMGTSS